MGPCRAGIPGNVSRHRDEGALALRGAVDRFGDDSNVPAVLLELPRAGPPEVDLREGASRGAGGKGRCRAPTGTGDQTGGAGGQKWDRSCLHDTLEELGRVTGDSAAKVTPAAWFGGITGGAFVAWRRPATGRPAGRRSACT